MDPIFDMKDFVGLVAVVLSLSIPLVVIVMVFIKKMKQNQQQKEIRQLIIENPRKPQSRVRLISVTFASLVCCSVLVLEQVSTGLRILVQKASIFG